MYRRPRLALALATSALLLWPAGAQATVRGGVTVDAAPPGHSFAVTLISGDTVHVAPASGGRYAVRIDKAKGREHIAFTTQRTKTGLRVIPADALPALAADRLDPHLFDVLALRQYGYDDAHRKDLPIMTTGGAQSRGLVPAARAVRTLPKLGITVLRAEKRDTAKLWTSLRSSRTSGKVWLVRTLRPTLDKSVPQIGAPSAWGAGQTGKGVKVAVLDTGYDANHPDLKDAVTEAKDFTGSPDGTKDVVGHGTHVASIIAGRGSASAGKYTGVAKGANLGIGKVCEDFGCSEDAILAGIDWAANSGAKVVNLSLGGSPREGYDPLVAAINYYTAETGTLFVIAAGNSGPQPESVDSPGIADAALTVGSVTKSDELSIFSSVGPRVVPSRRYDYGVKPDITAPGQDIVAARAEGTLDDAAVDKDYAQLSGTSMATPHVAGAAAILAGQHPDWSASQLKAALGSTAKRLPKLSTYQQGAGRLDVGRAVKQTVYASDATLNLGYFPWPNAGAPAARKTVTYTNTSAAPVTLKIALAVTDAKGKPAPAGMFTTSAKTVTVPARGTASVGVTVKPTAGPVGLYSGALVATSLDGKTVLTTGGGAYKEPKSYNLSVTSLGRDGQPADVVAMYTNRATGETRFTFDSGAGIIRLPAGDYTVAGVSFAGEDGIVEVRDVRLQAPGEVILDARRAKLVKATVDRADAVSQGTMSLDATQSLKGVSIASNGLGAPDGHTYAVPSTAPIRWFEFGVSHVLVKAGTGQEGQPPTPYTYNLTFPAYERIPAKLDFRFRTSELATVRKRIGRQGPDEVRDLLNFGFNPGSVFSFATSTPTGDLRERIDYMTAVPGVRFSGWMISGDFDWATFGPLKTYARKVHRESWNAAVFGPAFDGAPGDGPVRQGDVMAGYLYLVGDSAPGHIGNPWNPERTGSTRLLRNGTTIWQSEVPGDLYTTVPPGAATYRLETTVRRNNAWTQLSSQVDVAWTFRSAHVAGTKAAALPLSIVRFRPALDHDNQAPSSGAFSFPVQVERAHDAPASAVKSLTVEVSYDGGKTWKAAALTGSGAKRTATVQHPGTAGFASLRATAVDAAGNKVEQTILNAYALK